jgi:hypothetical protein
VHHAVKSTATFLQDRRGKLPADLIVVHDTDFCKLSGEDQAVIAALASSTKEVDRRHVNACFFTSDYLTAMAL